MEDDDGTLSRYNDRIFGLMLASWEGIKHEILNPVPLKVAYRGYKENLLQCLQYYERLWEHDEQRKLDKLHDSNGDSNNLHELSSLEPSN